MANVAVCQPESLSPVNVAWASRVPLAVHRLPTCVPVLAAALWKRMPVIEPWMSPRNFTPSSIAPPSPESTVDGAAKSKIVVRGITALDGVDARLVPTPLVAVTRNV